MPDLRKNKALKSMAKKGIMYREYEKIKGFDRIGYYQSSISAK